jgi:hypothetical protein
MQPAEENPTPSPANLDPRPASAFARLLAWCIPALILGGLLRFWMIQGWETGLYYGPDSQTYWAPIYRAERGDRFQNSEKRPWLYSRLMRATLLPGVAPARSAMLFQHLVGWLLVLPLADLLSKLTPRWRWWIIPATVVFACHPQLLFWEHVLIADSLFTALTLLACWAFLRFWLQPRHWPWLAASLALAFLSMATRPVGRALWLGMGGLLLALPGTGWRRRLAFSGAVFGLSLPAGKATAVNQGDTLFFTSVFPLLVLDRPPHLDVKAEFSSAVQSDRANLWVYISKTQRLRWSWLEADRSTANVGPAYHRIVQNKSERARFVSQLTRQALLAHPFEYLGMVGMKLYWLCGLNEKSSRIDPESFRFSQTKFLANSIPKYGPDFPAWLLGTPEATYREGIAEAAHRATANQTAQRWFGMWKDRLEKHVRLYRLPDGKDSVPWPASWGPLLLFGIGTASLVRRETRRTFLPVLALGSAYLILTLTVGRAVERYRLPAEFLFVCGICLGIEQLLRIPQRFNPAPTSPAPTSGAETPRKPVDPSAPAP